MCTHSNFFPLLYLQSAKMTLGIALPMLLSRTIVKTTQTTWQNTVLSRATFALRLIEVNTMFLFFKQHKLIAAGGDINFG